MLLIQKYGGTSVGTIERIHAVAAHVAATRAAGHRVVVVVSAMSGETNRLLDLVAQVSATPGERESDLVVATGEMVSTGLVALALQQLHVSAVPLLAHQIPIVTDGIFARARIESINAAALHEHLEKNYVVVMPGFQGVDAHGNLTTLGRGGSDTSAVAIAAALSADACEIYTDVDGVYSTDPRVCPQARRIEAMEYEELLEMAGAGAKIMHLRSVQLAAKYAVPLAIRSSLATHIPGTRVVAADPELEATLVSGITATKNEAKLVVRKVPFRTGVMSEIFAPLARANINVDMIVQTTNQSGEAEIGFTVSKDDLKKTMQLTERAARAMNAGTVEMAGDVSKLSIIGLGMRSHAGVAAKMFEVLAQENIPVQLISTSEIKVSVVINMDESERAVRALHVAFGLGGAEGRGTTAP